MSSDLLITGGLGLIGSEIAKRWEGERALVVDDGRANVVTTGELAGVAGVLVESVEGAAAANPRLAVGARAVIHCAAPVGPVGILEGSVLTAMVESTRAACRLAARAECALVVLSSSEVYGTTTPGPVLVVPDGPWSPRAEYAAGKIATELLAGRHHADTGLPTAIIRPWNVTGPRQSASKGFVLPRWVDAALAGEELTLYGDGMQERAIMAVEDFAELVLSLVDGRLHPEGAWSCKPLDAANPHNRTSLRHLAGVVNATVAGGRSPIVTVDPVELHGPRFAEAAAGSKLPMPRPALEGWTPLAEIVSSMATARAATLTA